MKLRLVRTVVAAGMVLLALAPARAARAQRTGDGFLFREPPGSLGLRFGLGHAATGSDVFSFTTGELTLDRGDFSSFGLGADLSIRLNHRFDLVLGIAHAGAQRRSEFRDWVDQDDRPIEQKTTFQRTPLTAGLKAYVTPRGRPIGNFAWVPSRYALYVGAGGGPMHYRFRQVGDFVDFKTREVFFDDFDSRGWGWSAHAMAGLDVSLGPRLYLTGEARYSWARAPMSRDFEKFDRIDLSGLWATAGVAVRF